MTVGRHLHAGSVCRCNRAPYVAMRGSGRSADHSNLGSIKYKDGPRSHPVEDVGPDEHRSVSLGKTLFIRMNRWLLYSGDDRCTKDGTPRDGNVPTCVVYPILYEIPLRMVTSLLRFRGV
jgi:hypothetical protein